MDRVKSFSVIALMILSVISVGTASGQVIYGQPASAKLRVIYTSWETKSESRDNSLDQIYMPFLGFIPLKDNLEARIFLGGVNNKLNRTEATDKLSGLTDTRIQINKSFSEDRLILSLGFNLPTGKTALNFEEEWFVTAFLSRDFLIYPLRRLGVGFGVNALFGGAFMAGDFRLGGSALYHYTGSYEAFKDNGDYDPGDFYSLNVGFKRPYDQFLWIGDVTFTSYTDDTQDGTKIYNRGNQFLFRMGGVWETPKIRASADARYFIRDRNAVYDVAGAIVNQLQMYGNEFSLIGSFSWFFDDKKWEVGPLFHLRNIAANEYLLGSALYVGFGAQASRWLSSRYELGVSFEYFTGWADGGNIDLSGYQIATSLSGLF